jgi:hypothetical protein
MAYRPEWLGPHLASLIVAALLALAALRRAELGRALYVGLFSWAAVTNFVAALRSPEVYLGYAALTESPTYRAIIEGPFARHVTSYVIAIAAGQAAIAAGLLSRGRSPRIAAALAIVFLVAIAPLGVGSGFPSTLIMAGGAVALLRRTWPRSLPSVVLDAVHVSRRRGPKARGGAPAPSR